MYKDSAHTHAFCGIAKLCGREKADITEEQAEEHPLLLTNGAMADVSRCNVLKPDTVKYMMRKMALMGMNQYMLYTEDVYEVEDYPYFGHLRGRYTKDEIDRLEEL